MSLCGGDGKMKCIFSWAVEGGGGGVMVPRCILFLCTEGGRWKFLMNRFAPCSSILSCPCLSVSLSAF